MSVVIGMLSGAGIGALVGLALYVLGFILEIFNCACNIAKCDFNGGDLLPIWSGSSFWSIMLFCSIGGAVIGLIYGIIKEKNRADSDLAKKNADLAEKERQQRVKWASEIKEKSLNVSNTCKKNAEKDIDLISSAYKSNATIGDIVFSITNAIETQGKVENVIDDIARKGGDVK